MKKILCFMLCLLMLPFSSFSAFADEKVNISIPLVVKESNGKAVPASLYRRGFALPEGEVTDLKDFGLYDGNGAAVESSFEITEKYKDGSIKWALCSFVASLKPDERKELVIKNIGATSPSKPVSVNKTADGIRVENEYINAEITNSGISTLTFNGVGFTDNISTFITENGYPESEFSVSDISVMTQTPLYTRVKIEAKHGSVANSELVFTLASGVKNAEIESRVIGLKQTNIYSLGLKMISNGTEFSYPSSGQNAGNVAPVDYITSTKNGVSAYFVTGDVEKFRGATSAASDTGFIFDSPCIYLAPLIGTKSFLWHDGLTRTNHLTVSFDEKGNELGFALKNPPYINVEPKSFEKADIIALSGSCAPIDRVINLAYHDLEKRNGRIDAGAIHYGNDPDTESFSSSDAHPGEMEHNFGIAYMATGDPALFRVMNESAEFWADVEVYKGSLEEVYGANRYRTDASYTGERFKTTHPYYGDSSGLYMSYVLTGNEYYRDSYKAAVEHMYSNMYKTSGKNCGFSYPHMKNWVSGAVNTVTYSESRYMIQARPLYYAYGLFGDEKFREAALEITRWAAHTQNEAGWWYQAYHDDGRPLRQGGQNQDAVKTYIWMYGLRGISFLSRYEDTPEIRLVLSRAGNFVENEYKNFGKGLWKPTGDPNLYECDEDKTRGKGPYEDIMALEILYRAYKLTGDESYFRSILDCTETWLSSMNPGGGTVLLANMEGKGTNTVLGGGQNYTLLQIFPELRVLFKEKANRIRELGYDYLLTVFDDEAKMYDEEVIKVGIKEPEVTQIIFEKGEDKVLFGTNFTGTASGQYTKDYETIIPEGRLWLGTGNKVSVPGRVTLFQHMKQFDRILARQIPVSVTAVSDEVRVFVDEYSEEKIILRAYGKGMANFRVDDGLFSVVPGKRYSVTAKRDGVDGARITICRSCINNLTVADDSLGFKVTLSSDVYIKDTDSVSAYSVARAGLMSLNSSSFMPDEAVDTAEFSRAVSSLTGTKKVFEGTDYEDAASFALEVMSDMDTTFFENSGIIKKEFFAVGNNISDEEAVSEGLKAVSMPEMLAVGTVMELPVVSVGKTSVEWSSDNSAVAVEGGVLTVKEETDAPVNITCTVKKGASLDKRNFVVKVKRSFDVEWYANTLVVSENKYNLKPQTGDFEINFDVTPKNSVTNAIVGFSDSSIITGAFSGIPIIFRFSPEGVMDAYNGGGYSSVEKLSYEGGKKYRVKVKVSLKEQKYSIYVTPDGDREYKIAEDFDFRTTAPGIDVVDVVYIPTATAGTELFKISYMDCASAVQEAEDISFEMYDENGLLFGKYAENGIYLPDYTDGKKITWIPADSDVTDSKGNIVLDSGICRTTVFGINTEKASVSSVDILKELELIEIFHSSGEKLTRVQAAEILNAIRYVTETK